MAVDIFIKIDDVKGESADDKHKNEIDVITWSWGATQSGTMQSGSGGGAGKVQVQDLHITKYIDKASPTLLAMCASGTHAKQAILTFRKAGGKPLEYLKITMEKVIISSISMTGSTSDDRLTETIALNFATFKYVYAAQKADGSSEPEITTGYNIQANKPL